MRTAQRSLSALGSAAGSAHPVQITVNRHAAGSAIQNDFLGLGYEISSVARPGLLSATNKHYVQLVRTLGPQGVMRIGGNTSDYSSFLQRGQAVSAPKATVVTESALQELETFLDATGWSLIWGLNLGSGSEQGAVEEAERVSAIAKKRLLAFEIGNEPDLFSREGHRAQYGYEQYLSEYRRYKKAIRAKLPNAPFAGPDAANSSEWVARFAADEGSDLKLLTQHYYREGESPTSTLDKLLRTDPRLGSRLEGLRSAASIARLPYRICETNSFSGGGRPGVSDTFGSALWALDFLFKLASANAAGVNLETGVNQLGFVSSYSPIGDDEVDTLTAKPEYYGMLAFAQASRGQLIGVDYNSGSLNLTAYAVVQQDKRVVVTLINKDAATDAEATLHDGHSRAAHLLRLTAPSLESKDGVTLGGSSVDQDGVWKPLPEEELPRRNGSFTVRVAAGSATLATLSG